MPKIVQGWTLSSLLCSAFAVVGNLYSVVDCPSDIYIMSTCSNLAELYCCTDRLGVRLICSYLSHLSDFPHFYNSIISRARYSLMSGPAALSWGLIPTIMAPRAFRQNTQPDQSVLQRIRTTFWGYIGGRHPVPLPLTAPSQLFVKDVNPPSTPIFITLLYQANSGSPTPLI
jgi:hypothetical protein